MIKELIEIIIIPLFISIIASIIVGLFFLIIRKKKGIIYLSIIICFIIVFSSLIYIKMESLVRTPYLLAKSKDQSIEIINNSSLIPSIKEVYTTDFSKNLVFSQDPQPDIFIKKGSKVIIKVSLGKMPEVPNIIGKSLDDAKNKLLELDFKVNIKHENNPNVGKNIVISQFPNSGTFIDVGSLVDVTVSTGLDVEETKENIIEKHADLSTKNITDSPILFRGFREWGKINVITSTDNTIIYVTADIKASAGYTKEVNKAFELNGNNTILLEINGLNNCSNKCRFDGDRLLKLTIDNDATLYCNNTNKRSAFDTEYIIARDGTYKFKIPQQYIERQYLNKIGLVFWNLNIDKIKINGKFVKE